MTRRQPKRDRGGEGGDRTSRRLMSWRDMLLDAPKGYSPFWLDSIQDDHLREHLRKLHVRLRREVGRGGQVTLMRDLILRRIVWCVRNLERIEQAIEHWDIRALASASDNADEMLIEYMRFYDYHARTLVRMVNFVLDSDFDKGIEVSEGPKKRVRSRVEIPNARG